jgi:NAD(P)-dependent dehydrogenase (short-subunit alcohol dehydrogenase family)
VVNDFDLLRPAACVLVNNAGVMLVGPFDSAQRADYRQMIEVNLLGAITATEVFLDQLKDGGGDIINISPVLNVLNLDTAPATTCENGPLAADSRLCGPFCVVLQSVTV